MTTVQYRFWLVLASALFIGSSAMFFQAARSYHRASGGADLTPREIAAGFVEWLSTDKPDQPTR